MRITDLPIDWRQRLTPASFRGAIFHVETGGRASGRRVALHEFPKRNEPYAEDMGRKAVRWSCQGYIIVSPFETDYIPARDALYTALEADGPGWLKLPTFDPMLVMVEQYKVDETREKGGIAVFDMVFVERGKPVSYDVQPDTQQQVSDAASEAQSAYRLMMFTSPSGRQVFAPDNAADYWTDLIVSLTGSTITQRGIVVSAAQLQELQNQRVLGLNQLFVERFAGTLPPGALP